MPFIDLEYNPEHQVLVYKPCQTYVEPSRKSIKKHLRSQPHRLTGQTLKSHLEYADALVLRSLESLWTKKPLGRVLAIKHLKLWIGYQCLLCRAGEFLTSHFPRIRDHTVVYSKKAKEHDKTPLWEECLLQSYFTTWSQVDYFVVTEEETEDRSKGVPVDSVPLSQPEKDLFVKLKKDYKDVKVDIEEQASIVYNIGDSRSEQVP